MNFTLCVFLDLCVQWSSVRRFVWLRGWGGGWAHLFPGWRHCPPGACWPRVGTGSDSRESRHIPPELHWCGGVGSTVSVVSRRNTESNINRKRWWDKNVLHLMWLHLVLQNGTHNMTTQDEHFYVERVCNTWIGTTFLTDYSLIWKCTATLHI